mgnify:FL=1
MRDFFRGKFFAAIVIILAFLLGFVVNAVFDGGTTAPENILGTVFTPVKSVATHIGNSVEKFFRTFADYDKLKSENETLKAENDDLTVRLEKSYHLETENERLRNLLSLTEKLPEYNKTEATVVSVSDDKVSSVFTINKGSLSGIKEKDVVIASDGLVGYVRNVGVNWATVVTILDPQVAVGAFLPRTELVAMTEGHRELKGDGLCRLSYLENTSLINRGDTVVTSGLGGLYPEGITIGKISEITVSDNGLSQYGIITPSVDFSSLRYVYVLSVKTEEGAE